MLKSDRAKIDLCCTTLVERLNMTKLWPKLIEYKIFNIDDVNIPRWETKLNELDTIQDILMTIKTRGPKAFNNLLISLRESDQGDLATILAGPGTEISPNNNIINIQINSQDVSLNSSQNVLQFITRNHSENKVMPNSPHVHNLLDTLDELGNYPIVINVQKSQEFLDGGDHVIPRYPMRSKPRGLVLIITLIDYVKSQKIRHAADVDHKNLKELFEQMGFLVVPYWDLSTDTIREKVAEFSKRPELRIVDSCFVIISGHGNRSVTGETVIHGIDDTGHGHPDQQISCLEIIEFFSAEKCPNLRYKPKVFMFQTCRGESRQYAVVNRGNNQSSSCNDGLQMTNSDTPRDTGSRNISDIFIVQSTLPGYVSFRDKMDGSWFIQTVCQVFMKLAAFLPIHDLLTIVDRKLSSRRTARNECQTVTFKNMGFNHLYINPGLFEDT